MDNKEAIERIKKRICCEKPVQHFCNDSCMHSSKCCEFALALKALEKQVPKKVMYREFEMLGEQIFCSECQHAVDDGTEYCPTCGQALDWSDEGDVSV